MLSLPVHAGCGTASSRSSLADRRRAPCSSSPGVSAVPFLGGLPHAAVHLPAGWTPRRWPSVAAHVAAPFPHELLRHPPPSVDPLASTPAEQQLVRGITSPAEFQQCLDVNSGKLVVLMCKARSCRPCKAFAKRYQTLAKTYPDTVFTEVFGDDSMELRGMMMQMKIKATPTFRLFRAGVQVGSLTGANANKLTEAILANLRVDEAGYVEQLPQPEDEAEGEPLEAAAVTAAAVESS